MDQASGVDVLCARPISPHYDFDHRMALYLAIGFVLATPYHRYLSVAAISFIVVYVGSLTVHSWAFVLAAKHMHGPSLNIYPVNTLLQICVFTFAILIYVRLDLSRRVVKYLAFLYSQTWVYISFSASTWFRYSRFENKIEHSDALVKGVQCQNITPATDLAGLFVAGAGVACQNPCAATKHHRLQPVLWGSISADTMVFRTKSTIGDVDWRSVIAIAAFTVVASITLIINLESSIRATRSAVYNYVLSGRQTLLRKQAARVVATAWFVWSLFCLGALVTALPLMMLDVEYQVSRFPVARACALMKWAPWVVGTAILFLGTLLYRKVKGGEAGEAEGLTATYTETKDKLVGNVREFGEWWSNPDEKSAVVYEAVVDEEKAPMEEEAKAHEKDVA